MMKENKEIRRSARTLLKGKWFWRLVTAGFALNFISQGVNYLMLAVFQKMGIQTWNDFLQTKCRVVLSGLDYTVPSARAAGEMTGAFLFQIFIAYIFAAILAYGFARVALKATHDDEKDWFSSAFDGFRRPLELAWLMLRMNLQASLWMLLFLFPGIIAVYRYRQAWYLKNEHPEWSVGRCLDESGKMMKGYKWQAFLFDLSYIGWGFAALITFVVSASLTQIAGGSVALSIAGGVFSLAGAYLIIYTLVYFFTGRALFYRALAEREQ